MKSVGSPTSVRHLALRDNDWWLFSSPGCRAFHQACLSHQDKRRIHVHSKENEEPSPECFFAVDGSGCAHPAQIVARGEHPDGGSDPTSHHFCIADFGPGTLPS